jgi:23S rRNA (cytidine1920-2'-O)/16S rRNA (cytidine1409-2'-O)-methyltransferase
MAQPRRRLDRALVARGLASDEPGAHSLIADGRILVAGAPALEPSRLVAGGDQIGVLPPRPAFVTRGGHKLSGALDDLGIPVEGRRCLDAGAGGGGFSDCLLQRGAREVVAVDVGYGDFAWKLRNDARVCILERVNIRTVARAVLGEAFDLIVADLSFISLALVTPALVAAATREADFLLLVKPQFEAARGDVGRGGVVVDPEVWAGAVRQVVAALGACGVDVQATVASRLRGAAGNQEFFVWGRRGAGRPS